MVCEPPDGGAAVVSAQLAADLGAHGFEMEYAGSAQAAVYAQLDAAGVPVHRLPLQRGFGHPLADSAALRALAALLRHGRFDLVHLASSKAGAIGRLAARRAGVPAVFAPHSYSFVGDFSAARRVFAIALERALRGMSDAVICCCEYERRVALEQRVAHPRQLHVVYNGTPACSAAAPAEELGRLRAGGCLALAMVPLRPQKSLDVLLEAAPRVLEALPDARLAVVGDGPERDSLRTLAETLGLDAHPRFATLPFREPAARYLAAADLYVLSSSWEGFPVGILEAQACGVPQVATDVGGTPEAVGADTGVLVPKRDPHALAEALVALLPDGPRRAAMARASRQRHAERFTLERMVRGTAEVYEAVLRRTP